MSLTKHIPNTITSMNLICGIVGVVLALEGNIGCAFVMMLLASLADFCDGLSARALGAYSDIGKELDSLCDVVSFGVLPAIMMATCMAEIYGWGCPASWIPASIAVFSAFRLAKFNIDTRQGTEFLGLPTPACAILCGSICHTISTDPGSALAALCVSLWFIPALSLLLSALLVCEIPMFSMKFHKGDKLGLERIVFFALVPIAGIACAVLGWPWSASLSMLFAGYIIINLAWKLL